uniref:uncharacterized protein LOC122586658 n=1 Tax=Erigeron canadensis TaxID=72917 RepID=UPI001CB97B01|nr:uncharacterized protein LOC122586658 [Erigeron canadensis]
MKLWEKVIKMRLRRVTKVAENQFGFMPGRSTMEAIHITRSLMEKYREKQKALHCAFLDLEKAYDSVPRQLIWRMLQAKGVTGRYIRGSALSPYLFTLIIDELSRGLQEELPWCMIFADYIALIARSTEELNQRIEKWREALEDHGLCVSREKTEYLRCDFDNQEIRQDGDEVISIGGRILCLKESFRYLGSVMHKSGK